MNTSAYMSATLRAMERLIDRRMLTRKQIGETSGLSQSKVSQLLYGTQRMHLDEYLKICDAIGVDPTVPMAIASAEVSRNERRNTHE